ncbi:MAG: carbohydrate kinase family protein [Fimbriimonadales bacterium]
MTHPAARTIVAAGHLCVDLCPRLPTIDPARLVDPGVLTEVGPLRTSVGGAAANTGQALSRLGFGVRIVAKVGDDPMAALARTTLQRCSEHLADWLRTDAEAITSYTVVLDPPGSDRSFLHCPGANATFGPEDVAESALEGAHHLHFGYPPLMERMASADGGLLVELFQRAHHRGLTTSLDMAYPDPKGSTGSVAWPAYLRRVLPHTDVFVPSLDEIALMLRREDRQPSLRLVQSVAEELFSMGASALLIKLGSYGAFAAASPGPGLDRLVHLHGCRLAEWEDRALYRPAFDVVPVATTGSGDAAIAGFLGGVVLGLGIEDCLKAAVGAGSARVASESLVCALPPWEELIRRIGDWRPSERRLAD